MRPVAVVFVALALAASAAAGTSVIQPAVDVGVPYWCDWGYDWDERCYRDEGARLPVGGVDDKVWRSALRFPLAEIPAGATVTSAQLLLHFDGVCVAPRRRSVACPGVEYDVDVHRVLTPQWAGERELSYDGFPAASAPVAAGEWVSWDITGLVRLWRAGEPNDGLLLKLADGEEDYDASGPYLPSSSFPDPALRPRLVVAWS